MRPLAVAGGGGGDACDGNGDGGGDDEGAQEGCSVDDDGWCSDRRGRRRGCRLRCYLDSTAVRATLRQDATSGEGRGVWLERIHRPEDEYRAWLAARLSAMADGARGGVTAGDEDLGAMETRHGRQLKDVEAGLLRRGGE